MMFSPPRLVALGAIALMAAGSLGVANAPDAAASGPGQAGSLRTGFENADGARWTTQDEEQAFLRDLDAASDRVRVRELARTKQGRPLQLVTVSTRRGLTDRAIGAGSSVLFLCSQHGNEPSGREACLQTMRNLAATDDPATLRMLGRTTVLFVPTANPDGTAANTRGNSDRVDINRDHLAVRTVEGQSIARLIRDLRPDAVHDLHEYGTIPGLYDWHMLYLWPRNLNVSQRLHDLGRELGDGFVAPALGEAGFTSSQYGIRRDGVQIAGNQDERILRNMVGLRHTVGLLSESAVDPLNAAEEADEALLQRRRVATQLVGARATLRMMSENRLTIALATALSRAEATVDGALGRTPFFFGGADNQPPTPEQVTTAPPCGYALNAEQFAIAQPVLDLHGVTSRPARGGGAVVSMAQPARRVIPLLLDARATFDLVEGTPLAC